MDLADLFLAKAAAGRDKDRAFCIASLQHHCVTLAAVMDLEANERPAGK